MNWYKKSQNINKPDLSLTLCGILYPINKDFVSNEFGEDETDFIDYYYGKLFEATSKFALDQGLDWEDSMIGEICSSIINSGSDNFSELFTIVHDLVDTVR